MVLHFGRSQNTNWNGVVHGHGTAAAGIVVGVQTQTGNVAALGEFEYGHVLVRETR